MKRIKTEHKNSLRNKVLNSLLSITINDPKSIEYFDLSTCVEARCHEKNTSYSI